MPTTMIDDARKIRAGTRIEADLCIIGGGAAGLTLAHELLDSRLKVVLLEAGGQRPDRATQSLLAGESPGYEPLEQTRLSCLGGTTRVWSGWCRPLDPSDLAPRAWVGADGWPFDRSALNPFYERAHAICELGPFDYRTDAWESESSRRLPLPERLIETVVFQLSPPTRFGRAYGPIVAAAKNITVLSRAVATELVPDPACRAISHVNIVTLSGTSFAVAARVYVLAAGGIENARLLLLSDSVQATGLGNAYDQVGRYFMEHPYVTSSTVSLARNHPSLRFYWPHSAGRSGARARVRGVFVMPKARLEVERLLQCALFLLPPHEAHPSMTTETATALRRLRLSLQSGWSFPQNRKLLSTVLRDPVLTSRVLANRILRRDTYFRRTRRLAVRTFCESVPNPLSRVRLVPTRDQLGRRRVRLNWKAGEPELRSMTRVHELLDEGLRRTGIGHVDRTGLDESSALESGRHHMGTTRMHSDLRRGVVDENCRVHGLGNLFIAGSSVFPTAGYANPTLTIVALAIRLADHIRLLHGDGKV